ncbi:outer membrane protein assembly factor BamC [Luminiphilus sp.]|jgi:outer membrane protein assembly factor BamC|nr:outer membrane protein assembly factor BamC [Luminiphilus sp.]MDA9580881.1 outer membrane protein assembly factor BamC [Luminiphilus sp.]MDB2615586.1 outer membrane protein assembly factor BamC [Luminiphilus sp.]MDC6485047.1 outer membrane protein assembly factor BamC [Luminiphilus sp.]
MERYGFVLVLSALLLQGCSWIYGEDGLFPDNTDRYQDAPELAVISVPPKASADVLDPTYPIPDVKQSFLLESEFEVPRPTPLTGSNQYETVRIQRLAEESWALVAVAPGQLWPQVRGFLTTSGIAVAASDAESGLIDTQFVTLQDRPLPTRFRFRVDTGVQRNTSELHVLQQNQSGSDVEWPGVSDDLELESEILRNIAQFIANSAEAAPVSMMADRAMGDEGRVTLEDSETSTRLILRLPFNRAWASMNKALPEAGFAIDDKDRTEGVFYLTFIGPQEEDESGWFDWMWGGEDAHPLANQKFLVKIASVEESRMVISLLGEGGGAVERRDQQALLTLIKGTIN